VTKNVLSGRRVLKTPPIRWNVIVVVAPFFGLKLRALCSASTVFTFSSAMPCSVMFALISPRSALSVAHLFRCNFLFGFCPLLAFGGKECLQTPETFIFNVVSRWTVAPSVIQGCAVGIVIVLWRFIARGRVTGRFLERHRQRKTYVKVCTSQLVFYEGEVWRQLRNRERRDLSPNFGLSRPRKIFARSPPNLE
jgi:hypothetical protein